MPRTNEFERDAAQLNRAINVASSAKEEEYLRNKLNIKYAEKEVASAHTAETVCAIFAVLFAICAVGHLFLGTILYAVGCLIAAALCFNGMRNSAPTDKEEYKLAAAKLAKLRAANRNL